MLLTITILFKKYSKAIDIQTSSQQKIIDVLNVLDENNVIEKEILKNNLIVKSKRNQEHINPLLSFEQANILNADIIIIE